MLQRVPVILAVTAHSYGLSLQARGSRKQAAAAVSKRQPEPRAVAADGKAAAQH